MEKNKSVKRGVEILSIFESSSDENEAGKSNVRFNTEEVDDGDENNNVDNKVKNRIPQELLQIVKIEQEG